MHVARPVRTTAIVAAVALAGLVAALVATTHAGAATASAQVNVRQTALGKILVDAKGRTLYMFAPDKNGKSSCYGKCATYWPPLLRTNAAMTSSGVKASLLTTTTRKGGQVQLVYDKHPLYRFAEDTKAGQTNGQGLNAVGGLWWVLSPTGAAIKKKAAPVSTTPTTTSTTTTTPTSTGPRYN
ncbi:MAG TPA: hypothetical protein VHV52_12970 [Gaiellaceae bacterium]|jgi:predicted lipoprotein with Yx(FWY)xxD motif|nr:hypothetical protein [Gaiellaceae bacterium]